MSISASPMIVMAAHLAFVLPAQAVDGSQAVQGPPAPGTTRFVVPESSIEHPGDVGHRARTTYGIGVPAQRITGPGTTVPPTPPR